MKKAIAYITLKYFLFFLFINILRGQVAVDELRSLDNLPSLAYYFFILAFIPIIVLLVLSFPIHLSFRIKHVVGFLVANLILLLVDIYIYIFFTSQNLKDINGVYLLVISCFTFFLFFRTAIKAKYKATYRQ
ncbi:MAG: hypothetical protein R2800_05190 [Flavipsychrobacter sp.]